MLGRDSLVATLCQNLQSFVTKFFEFPRSEHIREHRKETKAQSGFDSSESKTKPEVMLPDLLNLIPI